MLVMRLGGRIHSCLCKNLVGESTPICVGISKNPFLVVFRFQGRIQSCSCLGFQGRTYFFCLRWDIKRVSILVGGGILRGNWSCSRCKRESNSVSTKEESIRWIEN